MKKLILFVISSLLATSGSSFAANAATFTVFNTGVDDLGNLLPYGAVDPHYALLSAPNNSTNSHVIAPHRIYVPNSLTSQWIGSTATDGGIATLGDYLYQTTFDLTGLDPSTAKLTIKLGTDDSGNGNVFLNGVSLGIGATFVPLFSYTLDKGFVSGVNTLSFLVRNTIGATGLRLEVQEAVAEKAVTSVPEHSLSIFPFLATIGIGMLLTRRVAKRSIPSRD